MAAEVREGDWTDLAYRIEYSLDAEDHLRTLTAREQRIVLDTVDRQLVHQPVLETKNRRPMRPNPLATWELRLGNLRVYYDVQATPEAVVFVRAVGVKLRRRVRFGKEVIDL